MDKLLTEGARVIYAESVYNRIIHGDYCAYYQKHVDIVWEYLTETMHQTLIERGYTEPPKQVK